MGNTKHGTDLNRREALALAGAAIVPRLSLSAPDISKLQVETPIIRAFAERNRLYVEYSKTIDECAEIRKRVKAQFPPAPKWTHDVWQRDDTYVAAMRAADNAWAGQFGHAFHASLSEAGYDTATEQSEAAYERMSEVERPILDMAAQSAADVAIKLWIAIEFSSIGDDGHWGIDPEETLVLPRALLAAFHDHCRVNRLRVVGVIGKTHAEGLGFRWIGSDSGEYVE